MSLIYPNHIQIQKPKIPIKRQPLQILEAQSSIWGLNRDIAGEYISIVDSDSLDSNEITVLARVKADILKTVGDEQWNIVATKWFAPVDNDWHYALRYNGSVHKQNLFLAGASNLYSDTALSAGIWYDIGFTINSSGDVYFYLDGDQDGAHLATGGKAASSTSTLLIDDPRSGVGNNYGLDGTFDFLYIWDRALSADTIKNLYEQVKFPSDIFGLVVELRIQEGTGSANGTRIRDWSMPLNHGIMTNFSGNPWINVGVR